MTWMRPRERYGTRYLGMSPRGGIAGPPEPYYSETGAGCQCASPGFAAHIMVGSDMHSFAAAGAGFLLAVLWFDLMFDVQTREVHWRSAAGSAGLDFGLLPSRHD